MKDINSLSWIELITVFIVLTLIKITANECRTSKRRIEQIHRLQRS